MEQRTVGRSGLSVSLLGLGCNNFGFKISPEDSMPVLQATLDVGVTLFDTADTYGDGASEEVLGRAVAGQRDDVVILTKAGLPSGPGPYQQGASRKYLIRACEGSLRRLGTDFIDLYFVHRHDPATPIEETLGALEHLVRQGKVLHVGMSNLPAWRLTEARLVARHLGLPEPIATSAQWSLLSRGVEADMAPACRAQGIGLIPFFPLAAGLLTGKYRRDEAFPADSRIARAQVALAEAAAADEGDSVRLIREEHFAAFANERNLGLVEDLRSFAEARQLTLVELAMAWLAEKDIVPSIIAGATRAEQVQANAAALACTLDDADLAALDELLLPPGAEHG